MRPRLQLRVSGGAVRRSAPVAVALLVWCLTPAMAHASFGEVYGYGARAGGMAGAHTAVADDLSALYYNIAGLTFGKPGFGFGFHVGLDDATIRMKARPAGYDLPDKGADSPRIPTAYRLNERGDVSDIPNQYQVLLGGAWSLGIERLRLGFSVMLPANGLGAQQARYADEREQYFSNNLDFTLVGRRSEHLTILAGAAFRVFDWLSLGAGLSVMPSATTTSSVYLPDASRQDELDMSVVNQQGTTVGFNAGVVVQPNEHLRLGVAWRSENHFRLQIQNRIQINGFQTDPASFPVGQDVLVTVNYVPDTLAFGGAWSQGNLLVAADVVWAGWSGYLDHQGQRGRTFEDTVSVHLGGEYKSGDTTLRAGTSWVPSPVPDQTGRTNYVDNDRVRIAVGAGHAITLLGQQVELAWNIAVHHLLARDTDKKRLDSWPACAPGVTSVCDEIPDETPDPVTGKPDPAYQGLQTGNPGFPGWQSFGNLLSVGVDLKWRF